MNCPTTADEQKALRLEFNARSQSPPASPLYVEWLETLVIELRHAVGVAQAESHRERIHERHRPDRPPGLHIIPD